MWSDLTKFRQLPIVASPEQPAFAVEHKSALKNNLATLTLLAAVIILAGCTQKQQDDPEPRAVPVLRSVDRVCGHQFGLSEDDMQPSFLERESNSIIIGSTAEALLESLANTTEYRGSGNTRWSIDWAFDTRRSPAGCALTNVVTSVSIDYHLPLWPEQVTVSNRTLADQWNQYSDALRTYHCEHGRIGIDASIDVKSRLQDLQSTGSCDALIEEANGIARRVIGEYEQTEATLSAPQISDYLPQSAGS